MEHLNSVVNRIENGEAKLSPHDLIDWEGNMGILWDDDAWDDSSILADTGTRRP